MQLVETVADVCREVDGGDSVGPDAQESLETRGNRGVDGPSCEAFWLASGVAGLR
jgi:hypothetical protein